MVRATDPHYLKHVTDVMRSEFDRIGITVTDFKTEAHHQHYHSISRASAIDMGVKLSIEFVCDENQMKEMESLCHVARREHRRTPIPPPVTLFGQEDIDAIYNMEYEVETFYRCIMSLSVTGGSMNRFVEQFRKSTDKLFVKMESIAFDEEVTKMLTTNEYNI